MTKFFMTVGLPCSGKSEYAKNLAVEHNAEIFSSDSLREEMFGDVNHQADNEALFKELHKRIRECLASDKNAIYDATNINYKRRMEFLKSLNKILCEKIAILMATPYEICLERNAKRERKVPEEVIKRMYMNFWVPAKYEGFDNVQIVYSEGTENSKGYPANWLDTVMDYDQGNSHHSLTLGQHCEKTWELMDERASTVGIIDTSLRAAAILHDEGKPFTRTNINKKGEVTEDAHYYNHEHISSYDSLFFSGSHDKIYTACLIQWHMKPYLAWNESEKALNRDKKILGDKLFNHIMLLHECDVLAH